MEWGGEAWAHMAQGLAHEDCLEHWKVKFKFNLKLNFLYIFANKTKILSFLLKLYG